MNTKFLIALSLCFVSFTSLSQQLEKMVLENWKDAAWENRMQELPFYDEEGRIIRKEIAHWNTLTNGWDNQSKTEYTRGENGILLVREKFDWMPELSIWKASLRSSYSVNDQDKPSSVLTEAQDEDGWYNQSIDEYVYDANGNLLKKQLSNWDQESVSWVPFRKYEYHIESNRKAGYTVYFWDNKVDEWQSYKRASYQYSNEETVDRIVFESWIDGAWSNHSIRRNSFSSDDELRFMEVDIFDKEIQDWEKSSHVDYALTDFGKISTSTSKKWKSDEANWENLQRSTYYYSKNGEMLSYLRVIGKEMELFPNPTVENLTIRSLPKGTVTVKDALGKVVLQSENNEEEIQLDVSKWEMGVYSVQVNGNEVQQFVKQ